MGIKITCEECGWLVDETVYCHKCMFKAEDEVEELKAEVERLWGCLEAVLEQLEAHLRFGRAMDLRGGVHARRVDEVERALEVERWGATE